MSADPQKGAGGPLSSYLAGAGSAPLAGDVADAARVHLLDTVAAMVSGSVLAPGRRGAVVARALGGPPEALVLGTGELTGATAAALANGMAAHADETDDSHAPSLSHPGCAVVPAALAAGERGGASGATVLRAVVAGYDVGCRVGRALGRDAVDLRYSRPSSHAIVGTFGAAAAAAVVSGADRLRCAHILAYASQRASGTTTWQRDTDHIEKAFVFGGSPASSGVLAAIMVELGCTGVDDALRGHPNFLDALSRSPRPDELTAGLGARFEVVSTNVKRYAVGSPAQAAVQAAEELMDADAPATDAICSVEIILPADLAAVVDDRLMPDVNVQYLVAGTLLDGRCSFAMAHDRHRMDDADVQRLRRGTTLVADPTLAGGRGGEVRVHLTDGTVHRGAVTDVRGTAENPMTADEVRAKAIELMSPVLGGTRSEQVADTFDRIETVGDVRQLRAVLGPPG